MNRPIPPLTNHSIETLSSPNTASHLILWLSVAFVIIAITWSYFAVLDEVSTGIGKVIPSSKIQVIQNLEGGIVQKVLVKEGDSVKKGQTLMLIDDTRFASSYNEATVRAESLEIKLIRLKAEASQIPLVFPAHLKQYYPDLIADETELFNTRQQERRARIAILQHQISQKEQELAEYQAKQKQVTKSKQLIDQELAMTRPLLTDGAVSQVEILRLERQVNELDGQLTTAKISAVRVQQAIEEIKKRLDETTNNIRAEIIDDITTTKAQLESSKKSNVALADRVDRTTIHSPVDGTIKTLNITTVGGVIQPGMDLIEIVPLNDTLLIEAYINPADIGFIHPQQEATVKITAYDFSIYGGLPAIVEHISADTITNKQDESLYKIQVRTKKNLIDQQGEPLSIIPGMMATVDILTGQKTVLQYLLKPILKAKQKALRER